MSEQTKNKGEMFLTMLRGIAQVGFSVHKTNQERKIAIAESKANALTPEVLAQVDENELRIIELQDSIVRLFSGVAEQLDNRFDNIDEKFSVVDANLFTVIEKNKELKGQLTCVREENKELKSLINDLSEKLTLSQEQFKTAIFDRLTDLEECLFDAIKKCGEKCDEECDDELDND